MVAQCNHISAKRRKYVHLTDEIDRALHPEYRDHSSWPCDHAGHIDHGRNVTYGYSPQYDGDSSSSDD